MTRGFLRRTLQALLVYDVLCLLALIFTGGMMDFPCGQPRQYDESCWSIPQASAYNYAVERRGDAATLNGRNFPVGASEEGEQRFSLNPWVVTSEKITNIGVVRACRRDAAPVRGAGAPGEGEDAGLVMFGYHGTSFPALQGILVTIALAGALGIVSLLPPRAGH